MKLKTPFTVIANPIKDIDRTHEFSSKLTNKIERGLSQKDCKIYSSKSSCKLYEV